MQSDYKPWRARQRCEAVLEWAGEYAPKSTKQVRYHNPVYYFGCCHVFCSYKSQTSQYHQQDTRIGLAKTIRDWRNDWGDRPLADWIYRQEELAEKAGRKLPFVSYNTYHYNYQQQMVPHPPPDEPKQPEDLKPEPEQEEDLLEKHMAPPKFCSRLGHKLDVLGDVREHRNMICQMDANLMRLTLDLRDKELEMAELARENKDLHEEMRKLKAKLEKLENKLESHD